MFLWFQARHTGGCLRASFRAKPATSAIPPKNSRLRCASLRAVRREPRFNIAKYSDGRVEVVTYTLLNRSESISDQINAILRQTGKENAEEIARKLNVQKRVVSDTVTMRQLLEGFAILRVSPQLDTSITLDGTSFQFWYEAASNESYYSLVGGEPGYDNGDHPLVK